MTTLDALVATWRVAQLAAYQAAVREAARPNAPPLHQVAAMHESIVYARCANDLDAAIRRETPS